MLSNYLILFVGFLLALTAAGVDLSKVSLVIGALGVGLGFGLQNMVSNFVSGLILAFERPIESGDVVEVGNVMGEVEKIGFRASVVRTFEGAEVIIPNGELVWGRVINWSLTKRVRRIEIQVGVAYGSDPQNILQILQDVAVKHPAVLPIPPPDALFETFGDNSLGFKLMAWARLESFQKVRSELSVAIESAFKQAGVQLPLRGRNLYVEWPETAAIPQPHKSDS
jgi:small-conductance mechanosensitive channel